MLCLAVGDLNHDGFLDVYGSYAEIYNNPSNPGKPITQKNESINDGGPNDRLDFELLRSKDPVVLLHHLHSH